MKYVYDFKEGNKDMRNLLGGKGANLAEMTNVGLPVPNGFTITTEVCTKYYSENKTLSDDIINEIFDHLNNLEQISNKKFGDATNPLLISVRSGARASMPGMMDTILNLGLNDIVVEGLAKKTNNRRFAYDSYRRFVQMFSDVVKGFPKSDYERLLDKIKEEKNVKYDTELTEEDIVEVTRKFKDLYKSFAKEDFPQDAKTQLIEAVKAVFRSWNTERAIYYRQMNDIPSSWGTAVNIQEMVYGNSGENSGTGVAFTRNPSTGEKVLFGEYLINAQGEDVVAGIRTPEPISTLKDKMPECFHQFENICNILEEHYKDMQDMEFTIENGKLFMLQTRNAKRTAQAAIKVAVDMVNEGIKTKEEAIMMVDTSSLDALLHPNFDKTELEESIVATHGLAASPGAACGKIYFTAEDVKNAHDAGEKDLILVRLETSPEDIEGMHIAHGVLTVRGGMTSHAAVVARGMGTCCVSGCSDLVVDKDTKTVKLPSGLILHEGDYISLDGSTGNVYAKKIPTVPATISGDFETFLNWSDEMSTLKVRANADNPTDANQARVFGARGIGLCRTEHMFFNEDRIFNFRRMITAPTEEMRRGALDKILPYQREDFEKLFEAMKGYPVVIRYLDPPLHEFLPHTDEEIKPLAESLNMAFEALKERIDSLKEFNPMMGHRGCRLSITYPEIAEMQTRAVIEAAINVNKKGLNVVPEIMIPLVGDTKELEYVKKIVVEIADKIISENNISLKYMVGTMIEIPRACIIADEIAKEAEFFSFGTNDLTQLTYGFSRDDSSKFLKDYYAKKIFTEDPFAHVDEVGVGSLMKMSIEKAKTVRPNIDLGICGEQGGDPRTIAFCHKIGLTYVSCSPYRVPIARLAAAQAAIKTESSK